MQGWLFSIGSQGSTSALSEVLCKHRIMHEAAIRRVRLAGVLICSMCLAYFYVLDRILFSSTHFSPIFRELLTVYDSSTAWLALAICILAALWNRPAPISRLVEFLGNHPYLVSLASVALFGLGAVRVYHDYPFSMDEYAAVFQAKIFALGHLYAQLPRNHIDWLVVSGFNGSFLVASPKPDELLNTIGRALHYCSRPLNF